MMASATNFEVSHVTNEPKSLLRAKESETVRFETVLKKTASNNADSKLSKTTNEIKSDNINSLDSSSLNGLIASIDASIDLLLDVDKEQLLAELDIILDEIGLSSLDDLGIQDQAVIAKTMAALYSQQNTSRQDGIGDDIKQIILAQLFTARPEINNSAVFDEEVKMPINTSKEASLELVSSLPKEETKPKISEANNFRFFEDKLLVKTDNNPNQTDVKKLISSEINRISGVKSSTTANNTLITEQPVLNEEEPSSTNLTKLEQLNIKSDTRIFQTNINNRPVEVKEVIDQIVNKAELLVKQNASEIKINLKPEFLGKLTIKIAVEEGIVTARFITENLQVKHLLESNLNTLRQSLESQGIKVEKTEVNVQLNNGGMFDGSENGRESRWESPEYLGNYQTNESDEEMFNFHEEIPVSEDEVISGYSETYEEGALSFLI